MRIIKTTIAAMLMIAFFSCSKQGVQVNGIAVPESTMKKFEADHPDVKAVWFKDGKTYAAEYQEGGLDRAVFYDASGNVVMTEAEIATSEVPSAALEYVSREYPDAEVTEAELIKAEGRATVELELTIDGSEVDLLFDEMGNFLGEENDDDGGDDHENEEDND